MITTVRSLCGDFPKFATKVDDVMNKTAACVTHLETVQTLASLFDTPKDEVMASMHQRYNNAKDWMTSVLDTGSSWVSSHTPSAVSSVLSNACSHASSVQPSTYLLGGAGVAAIAGLTWALSGRPPKSETAETKKETTDPGTTQEVSAGEESEVTWVKPEAKGKASEA